jgi:hypothetical protein
MYTWDYTIKYYTAAYLTDPMFNLAGKVNEAVFSSRTLGRIFQPETLLYHGPEISRTATLDGTEAFNITFSFSHRPTNWNKFPDPKDGYKYKRIGINDYFEGESEFKAYELIDFTPLKLVEDS